MNKIFLRQQLAVEGISSGKFEGIAYSGGVIEQHGWIKNLIIDLSTLTVAKAKTPVLRDHNQSQVIGHGQVLVAGDVRMQGQLAKRNSDAEKVITLAEEGTDWEMSIGVYGGQLVEFKDETINGTLIKEGTKLINGLIREVSFVILGADMDTKAEVFSLFTEENQDMKLNAQNADWTKFACGCGGHKDSTPEELEASFKEKDVQIANDKQKLAEKEDECADWKKKYEEAQAKLEKQESESKTKVRSESISAAATAKHITLKPELIEKASKTEVETEIMLATIDSMPALTPKEMRGAADLGDAGETLKIDKNDPEALRLGALKMVEDGKAKNFAQAIELITQTKET